MPAAEIIGKATVSEHLPNPDMSWIAATLFNLSIIPIFNKNELQMYIKKSGKIIKKQPNFLQNKLKTIEKLAIPFDVQRLKVVRVLLRLHIHSDLGL
jgi:hypothetical protein